MRNNFGTIQLLFFPILLLYINKITIWGAIQKRSHEPINKIDAKNEAKRLRAKTIAKLEER